MAIQKLRKICRIMGVMSPFTFHWRLNNHVAEARIQCSQIYTGLIYQYNTDYNTIEIQSIFIKPVVFSCLKCHFQIKF